MLRKALTLFSLVGLLLSVGLWASSYCCLIYTRRSMATDLIETFWMLSRGGIGNVHAHMPIGAGFEIHGFHGFETYWLPSLPSFSPLFVHMPLWIPSIFFAGMLVFLRAPRRRRRRKRKKLGQCVGCGYDLKGLTELRCPECNTAFC